MLTLAIAFLGAVIAGLVVTPLVVNGAHACQLYDHPTDVRRVHTEPIPRLGGVAVAASFCCGLLAALAVGGASSLLPNTWELYLGVLLGGGLLFAAGLMDDVRGLGPVAKLIVQFTAAGVVYASGLRIETLSLGPVAELSLDWATMPLTILWIVAVTNAFNLIDGLDGLATGVALVALAVTMAVSLVLGNVAAAVICAALIGALLGFLRYNFSPAKIFLGDCGSLFVGYLLAVLSVHGSMRSGAGVLVVIPLFVMAVPLLDTLLAIGRRWLRCVPVSNADSRHIHHRLLALGLTHRSATLVLCSAAAALALLGYSLAFAPPTAVRGIALAGGVATVLALFHAMRHLQYHEFMEAGSVLASGLFRARRVIRDQILARDLTVEIQHAQTPAELLEILRQQAPEFGFLHMEVCREGDAGRERIPSLNGQASRAWKLDYPVATPLGEPGDPFVLRIWCRGGDGFRPYGAERVARILAPSVEAWLGEAPFPMLGEEATDPAIAGTIRSTVVDGTPQHDLEWATNGTARGAAEFKLASRKSLRGAFGVPRTRYD